MTKKLWLPMMVLHTIWHYKNTSITNAKQGSTYKLPSRSFIYSLGVFANRIPYFLIMFTICRLLLKFCRLTIIRKYGKLAAYVCQCAGRTATSFLATVYLKVSYCSLYFTGLPEEPSLECTCRPLLVWISTA